MAILYCSDGDKDLIPDLAMTTAVAMAAASLPPLAVISLYLYAQNKVCYRRSGQGKYLAGPGI